MYTNNNSSTFDKRSYMCLHWILENQKHNFMTFCKKIKNKKKQKQKTKTKNKKQKTKKTTRNDVALKTP